MNLSQIRSEKKLKKICGEAVKAERVEGRRLADVIKKSREAFYESQAGMATSRLEFLYQQSRYIKKGWWLAQAGLLLFLWLALQNIDSGYYLPKFISFGAPLFVVFLIPELWKSLSAGAVELECSTYYSLRQVYAARLICFALVDLTLLSVFFAAVCLTGGKSEISVMELIIHFFVPFNVACCICFGCFYGKRRCSSAAAMFLCMVWAVFCGSVVLDERLYSEVAAPLWVGLLVLSVVYLAYCIARGQRRCECLWEEKSLWNLN